jgi:hypothetical protein
MTNGVDYMVVDSQTYSEEYLATGRVFIEPYNQELLPQLISRDMFILNQVPDESKVLQE